MVFVTGDTHYPIDSAKLFKNKHEFVRSRLTRKDYLIVLGDFGLFWTLGSQKNLAAIEKVQRLEYTLLFVDGNHENFDWLEKFPVIDKFGGKARCCGENIFHLMRGEIYTIEDRQFFVCGGAASVDKQFRYPHISWWPQEDISGPEERKAIETLDNANGRVDFILTHTCPESIILPMLGVPYIQDTTSKFLETVKERLPSAPWYFGHWHTDKDWGRFHAMYNRILRVI